MKSFLPRFLAVVVFILLVFFQTTSWVIFFGVRPNLVLILLTTLSFFVGHWLLFLAAAIFAGLVIFSASSFWPALVLVVLGLSAFWLGHRLPGRPFFNNSFIIILSTLIFYGVINPDFLSLNPMLVVLEASLNVFLGSLFFWFLLFLFRESHEKKARVAIR